jgi:hypothetical protein
MSDKLPFFADLESRLVKDSSLLLTLNALGECLSAQDDISRFQFQNLYSELYSAAFIYSFLKHLLPPTNIDFLNVFVKEAMRNPSQIDSELQSFRVHQTELYTFHLSSILKVADGQIQAEMLQNLLVERITLRINIEQQLSKYEMLLELWEKNLLESHQMKKGGLIEACEFRVLICKKLIERFCLPLQPVQDSIERLKKIYDKMQ